MCSVTTARHYALLDILRNLSHELGEPHLVHSGLAVHIDLLIELPVL